MVSEVISWKCLNGGQGGGGGVGVCVAVAAAAADALKVANILTIITAIEGTAEQHSVTTNSC